MPQTGLLGRRPGTDVERVRVFEIQFDKKISNLARRPPNPQECRDPNAVRRSPVAVFGGAIRAFPVAFRQIPDLFQRKADIFPLDVGKERISQGSRPGSLRALGIRTAGPAPVFTTSGIESSSTGPIAH